MFLLWHCWRCTICKRKSENSHSRRKRLGWWSDESGAPLCQIWGRDESGTDPSAEGMIESSTGPEELNDTQPNTVWLLVPPNAGPDPDRSSASEIPGQTCTLRNRTAWLLWGWGWGDVGGRGAEGGVDGGGEKENKAKHESFSGWDVFCLSCYNILWECKNIILQSSNLLDDSRDD